MAAGAQRLDDLLTFTDSLVPEVAQKVTGYISDVIGAQASNNGSAMDTEVAKRLRSAVVKLASVAAPPVGGEPLVMKTAHMNVVISSAATSDALADNALTCDDLADGPQLSVQLPTGLALGGAGFNASAGSNGTEFNASNPVVALMYTSAAASMHEAYDLGNGINADSSPMLSFSLVQQKAEIKVKTSKDEPILLSLPFQLTELAGAPANAECRWHDANRGWVTDGCTTIVDSRQMATCSCEHLTDFTIFSMPENATDYRVKLEAMRFETARVQRAFECRFNVENPDLQGPPDLQNFGWVATAVILVTTFVLVLLALLRDAVYERASVSKKRYLEDDAPKGAFVAFCSRHVLLSGVLVGGMRGYTRGQSVQIAMGMLSFEVLVVSWLVTPHAPPFTLNTFPGLVAKGIASALVIMISMVLFIVAFHPEIFVSLFWSQIKTFCFFIWLSLAPCRRVVLDAYHRVFPLKIVPEPPPPPEPPNKALRLLLETAKRVEEKKWDKREQLAANLIAGKMATLAPARGDEEEESSEPGTPNSTAAGDGIAWTRSRPCMSRPVTAEIFAPRPLGQQARPRAQWTPSLGLRGETIGIPGGAHLKGLDGVSRPATSGTASSVGAMSGRQILTPMSSMGGVDNISRPTSGFNHAGRARANVTPLTVSQGLDGTTPPASPMLPNEQQVADKTSVPKLGLQQLARSPCSDAAGSSHPPLQSIQEQGALHVGSSCHSAAGAASPPPSPPFSLASISRLAREEEEAEREGRGGEEADAGGGEGHHTRIDEEAQPVIEYTEEMQEALRELKGDFSSIKDPVVRAGLERMAADRNSQLPAWKIRRIEARKKMKRLVARIKAAYASLARALHKAFSTVPNPYKSATKRSAFPTKRDREDALLARQYVSRAIRRCDITALTYIIVGWSLNWGIQLALLYTTVAYSCELTSWEYSQQTDLAWTFFFSAFFRNCVFEPLLVIGTYCVPYTRKTYFAGPNFVT